MWPSLRSASEGEKGVIRLGFWDSGLDLDCTRLGLEWAHSKPGIDWVQPIWGWSRSNVSEKGGKIKIKWKNEKGEKNEIRAHRRRRQFSARLT